MTIKDLIQAELELLSEEELTELYELIKKRVDVDDDLGNLLKECQVNTVISDLSSQHAHYLYGLRKR